MLSVVWYDRGMIYTAILYFFVLGTAKPVVIYTDTMERCYERGASMERGLARPGVTITWTCEPTGRR